MPIFTTPLKYKSKGEAVIMLKEVLSALGNPVEGERADYFGKTTEQTIKDIQRKEGLDPSGVVNVVTYERINKLFEMAMVAPKRTISGVIYDEFDAPIPNVQVVAYDKDIRSEEKLGAAVTDHQGQYQIAYQGIDFIKEENKTADVFIRVLKGAQTHLKLLGESKVHFNVPDELVLDFKLDGTPYRGESEFDQLIGTIEPLIAGQELQLADLREDEEFKDLSFLAGETGEAQSKIALLPLAFQFSIATDIAADVFYGLFRLQFPTVMEDLLSVTGESIAEGIRTAIRENIISAKWEKKISNAVRILTELGGRQILANEDGKNIAFKEVIGTTLADEALQETFVTTFLKHEATLDKFWKSLAKEDGFDEEKVARVQSSLRLNQLTLGVSPLTALLIQEQQGDEELKDLRGFAKFTPDDWSGRVNSLVESEAITSFPPEIKGETIEEKAEDYANTLNNLVGALYPTDVFRNRLTNDAAKPFGASSQDLDTFLANNPDFDLRTNQINTLLAEAEQEGIEDKEGVETELKTINRLYKLSPRYEDVGAMRQQGVNSATGIINTYSREEFVEVFQDSLGPDVSENVYNQSIKIDKQATALLVKYKTRHDIPMRVMDWGPVDGRSQERVPADYQTMFGTGSLCHCEHCQSVYSPAAYFVDMLSFLGRESDSACGALVGKEATATRPAVIGRREDLKDIKLTCKNTNTPLPHIDLVNELLENQLLKFQPQPPVLPVYQTNNTAAELDAFPEHVNVAAYDVLKTAHSSWALPLNLSLEATRLYLAKLSLKRHDLMALHYGKQTESIYDDVRIAADYLGLSTQELELLNGTTTISAPAIDVSLRTFLEAMDISYLELLALLESYFINPIINDERKISITARDGITDQLTCDIDELQLEGLEAEDVEKMMRFYRLWKKLGWDSISLDKFLTVFKHDGSGVFSNDLIRYLSFVVRYVSDDNLNIEDALLIWGNFDTNSYHTYKGNERVAVPSLYEQLFLNKKISPAIEQDFVDVLTNSSSATLEDHIELITAALNISASDFALLRSELIINSANQDLTLVNLTIIYRYTLLGKLLRLSIPDLLFAMEFVSDSAQTNFAISDTVKLIDRIRFVQASGFSIGQLRTLLTTTAEIQPAPVDTALAGTFTTIREGLQQIARQFDEALKAAAEPLVDVTALAALEAEKLKTQKDFVANAIASSLATDAKVAKLLLNDVVKSTADNTTAAVELFLDPDFISEATDIYTIDAAEQVVWGFPVLRDTYALLERVGKRIETILSNLRLSTEEFAYFYTNGSEWGMAEIWELPTAEVASPYFLAFEKLIQLVQFRNVLPAPRSDWYTLFDAIFTPSPSAKSDFLNELAALSRFEPPQIEFLTGAASDTTDTGVLNLDFPADYTKGIHLINILAALRAAHQFGTTSATLIALTAEDGDETNAQSLLKSKYDEATWLEIVKPISDELREKKRDALTDYFLTSPATQTFRTDHNIVNTNHLYEHFLIDVEMAACMKTSRIKQAILVVQLFVDRCLMNLEEGVTLSANFGKQWNKWRKVYRIWEANRKIFLYPENWIEPELRDDKTPLFKNLEKKLGRNEVTDEIAEDALREYLEELDRIANLEVIGFFDDEETNILHVIGRTKNIPHLYYYRKQERSVWAPWEKVDLDIEGDHILPVVWNGRLYLFWGVFEEKQEESGGRINVPPLANGGPIESAKKYWEMKLAWSEHKHGKWDGKKNSKDSIPIYIKYETTDDVNGGTDIHIVGRHKKEDISISSALSSGNLEIIILSPKVDIPVNIISILSAPTKEGQAAKREGGRNEEYKEGVNSELVYGENSLAFQLNKFVFKNCNDSPKVLSSVLVEDNPIKSDEKIIYFTSLQKVASSSDKMILHVSDKTSFKIFNSGLFSTDGSSQQNTEIFKEVNGSFKLLPNYSNVADSRSIKYFFTKNQENYFSHSKKTLAINDDLAIVLGGNLERIALRPVVNNSGPLYPKASDIVVSDRDVPNEGFEVVVKNDYYFTAFYHPYVCEFIANLNTGGVERFYHNFSKNRLPNEYFEYQYKPSFYVKKPYPKETLDFSYTGTYSIYNWELFFHIPLYIATRLSQNQKFDEARKWFHYIFDPTQTTSMDVGPARYWKTKPFKQEIADGVLSLTDLIGDDKAGDLKVQLDNWERHPFQPHAVARLRNSAYMRSTVMKYIDNLIAWGDRLFQRDTLESLNEATLLYVLASNMLGKRPLQIPARAEPADHSYADLTAQDVLDAFSNAKLAVENLIDPAETRPEEGSDGSLLMPYFCLPANDELLKYWDTVADRLFKIRNCMNIEGVVRQLPLFEPPIDPALLVRATAAGLDLNAILNDVNASLSPYRFQVMLQKAKEICSDVKALGGLLLSVLEKKDAESLALLRSSQEIRLLDIIMDIKELQKEEAKTNLASLRATRKVIEERKGYYESRQFMNPSETLQIVSLGLGMALHVAQSAAQIEGSIAYKFPDIKTGSPFSAGLIYGGSNVGASARLAADMLGTFAGINNIAGTMSGILGSFERRQDDWQFQASTATLELKQIDQQIIANEIRLAIAEKEIESQRLQIENANAIDEFLQRKFTNEELYQYMVGKISGIYFQCYQLAYDTARKAEKCMEVELRRPHQPIIKFGYWDSLRKGLLAGEQLGFDLQRLDMAYLDRNVREFELTKHISLRQLDPMALLVLKATGSCKIELPEWLFDMDNPGHYMRRIKSVGLSIPAISGPYTSINCTMSMTKSCIRTKDTLPADDISNYSVIDDASEDRFDYDFTKKSVVTSSAQNDSGLFEVNLRDERFLPFENAGVISKWELELPNENRQFDYNTITDIILHVRYCARPGSQLLKDAANESVKETLRASAEHPMLRLFSLRHDFPSEWHKFETGEDDFRAIIRKEHFNYFTQGKTIGNLSITLHEINDEMEVVEIVGGIKTSPDFTETNPNAVSEINQSELVLFKHIINGKKNLFLILNYSIS